MLWKRFSHGVLYALVASDCKFAVDVFTDRGGAKRALADVLADEPGFVAQFHVIALLDETTDDEIARLN